MSGSGGGLPGDGTIKTEGFNVNQALIRSQYQTVLTFIIIYRKGIDRFNLKLESLQEQ